MKLSSRQMLIANGLLPLLEVGNLLVLERKTILEKIDL